MMKQHSLHIFLGNKLADIANGVNQHLGMHCNDEGRYFSHVAAWSDDNIIRQIGALDEIVLSNPQEITTPVGGIKNCVHITLYYAKK